jgi:hypothetical protein
MSLSEYYAQVQAALSGSHEGNFTRHVAAEVAAGYEIGLTIEQVRHFLACRTEITSVAVALNTSTLSAEQIGRILEARRHGAGDPKAILAQAFTKGEVQEKFHREVFGDAQD